MIAESDRKIAERIARELLAHNGTRICRIILYGSRASGTAGPESDFDMLVIEKDPVSKWEEMKRLRQAIQDSSHPVDIRVMREEEFEETKAVIGGLAYPASKYGVVLYENP